MRLPWSGLKEEGVRHFLSRLGVGSPKVDLLLPEVLVAGEEVAARLVLEGGVSDHQVDAIHFALCGRFRIGDSRTRGAMVELSLGEPFVLGANTRRELTLTLPIPHHAPMSTPGQSVWIETGLSIDWSLDPTDLDEVEVRPSPLLRAGLDALTALGFECLSVENLVLPSELGLTSEVVQSMQLRPTGVLARRIDEVEVIPIATADEVLLLIEVDRKEGALEELIGADDARARLRYGPGDVEGLEGTLRDALGVLAMAR